MEIVRRKYNFSMIDIQSRAVYPTYQGNTPDIQILYSDVVKSGHYICVYYDTNLKTVYIYDSFFNDEKRGKISDKNFAIMKSRYPMAKNYVHVLPKIEQYDETSSGPIVIAYTTTLILNDTPAAYSFKMETKQADKAVFLRHHIFEMFRAEKLSLFPRYGTCTTKFIFNIYIRNELSF